MSPIEQAMLRVIEETFESLAFMFPVESDHDASMAGEEPMEQAIVDFTGPFPGRVCLSASPRMLEPLAANMLGLEDGTRPTDEQKQDAFKELLNVICGNLLPQIASPIDVFNVEEPRSFGRSTPPVPPPSLKLAGSVESNLDGGRVRLSVLIESHCLPGVMAIAAKGAQA
jgi:hypothetical protein